MKRYILLAVITLAIVSTGCRRHGEHGDFPDDFSTMSDTERMAYMMKEVTPDSVARFVCDAALGKIPGVKIDTLATANLYALEHYRGENVDIYSREYDDYKSTFSLSDKMRIEQLSGVIDRDALGYQLGLEYVGRIREQHLSENEVEKEISELRKNCDAETFSRFMTGFRVALQNDRGKDLPEGIYRRFISYR